MLKNAELFVQRLIRENKQGIREEKTEVERIEKTLHIHFPKVLAEIYIKLPIIGIETHYHGSKPKELWRSTT